MAGHEANVPLESKPKIDEIEQSNIYIVDENGNVVRPQLDSATNRLLVDSASTIENLKEIGGQTQSAVDVADKIDQIEDALASVGTDEMRVVSPNPLDVSAAEIDVDIATQSLSPLTITDDGAFAINAYNGGTLPVEQQTAVKVEDTTDTTIDPFDQADTEQINGSDSGTGSANAAQLSLGDFRKDVDVFVDTSGDATLTVEVSEDGGTTWRELDTVSYTGASTEVEQYSTVFGDIRAYLNQNRNEVVAVSRGI